VARRARGRRGGVLKAGGLAMPLVLLSLVPADGVLARALPWLVPLWAACAAVLLLRLFFAHTRAFLDRFEELPAPASLSGAELTAEGLLRLEGRWRTAGQMAMACALLAALPLWLGGVEAGLEPEAPPLERVEADRAELERALEGATPAGPRLSASAAGNGRIEALAQRLEQSLDRLRASDPGGAEPSLLARCDSLLARARGRPEEALVVLPAPMLEAARAATRERALEELALCLERARALRAAGRTGEALSLYERALALDPERLALRLELAGAELELGAFQAVLGLLEIHWLAPERASPGAASSRESTAGWLLRARACEGLGEAALALEACDRALAGLRRPELFPPAPETDAILAELLAARAEAAVALGRFWEAEAELEQALALWDALPDSSQASRAAERAALRLLRGRLFALRGAPQEALAELEAAADPARLRARLGLARVRLLAAAGRTEQARQELSALALAVAGPGPEGAGLVRIELALLGAELALAGGEPEPAAAGAERAALLLAQERARGAPTGRLDALAERLLALRSSLAPPASSTRSGESEVPALGELHASLELLPEGEPRASSAPLGIDAEQDALDRLLEGEEDPRQLAHLLPALLERADQRSRRDGPGAALADLDRAVGLARAWLGVEREASPAGREAARALCRALGQRGRERSREGRLALAWRALDERVLLLEDLAGAGLDPVSGRELALALRERGLVAFNQRDRTAALADLEAAIGLLERLRPAEASGAEREVAELLERIRRELTLVAGDPPRTTPVDR
jgi:tetratricopeptide (TPR) repeat protein